MKCGGGQQPPPPRTSTIVGRESPSALRHRSLLRCSYCGQRGIVPLAGFYLWQRAAAGHHQPYYVRLVNRAVFGVAALWDRAEAHDELIESCALITVDANPLLTEIDATGQMPAILRSQDYDAWLSSSVDQAKGLLAPYPHTQMVCHPVAPYVNHLEFDDPKLIRPTGRF